jgi:transcriptional regulator with XRE-family HTH domain
MRSQHTQRYKVFIKRLREARIERGLTQEDVARLLRIPASRVSRMETGERRVDVIELADLARLYRRPLTFFVP